MGGADASDFTIVRSGCYTVVERDAAAIAYVDFPQGWSERPEA